MPRCALIAASALVAASLFVPPDRGAAAQSGNTRAGLCAADETILFHCRIGNQFGALCGRRIPVTRVRYLFGQRDRIEYSSPADTRFWWMPGSGMDVRFRDGEDEYSIYRATVTRMSADGRYEDNPVEGVRVMRGERLFANYRCSREAHSAGPFQAYMPEGEAE